MDDIDIDLDEDVEGVDEGGDFEPVMERSFIMINAVTDPVEWRLELERVSVRLSGDMRGESGWRDHLRQAKVSLENVGGEGSAEVRLRAVGEEAGVSREGIAMKEKGLSGLEVVRGMCTEFEKNLMEKEVLTRDHSVGERRMREVADALEDIEVEVSRKGGRVNRGCVGVGDGLLILTRINFFLNS